MDRGVRHQRRDVLGFFLFGPGIGLSNDQRRRRAHARENVPHIRLPQDPGQGLGNVGAERVARDPRVAPDGILVDRERVTLVVGDTLALCRAVLRLLTGLLCRPPVPGFGEGGLERIGRSRASPSPVPLITHLDREPTSRNGLARNRAKSRKEEP